ncbi:hypothetical protein Pla123a_24000 [Posidoniimonas polymericola]|uniref:Uncharacterized protein n=1 Tax=Posidoniimonas polymericola TaxID=2528002 RepID=A0A5C5YPZ6_9BACT|nr:hypothetical protein [Posidoniimonas polymericola]TWT76975.1 hypothetical protein Pla123a_24000 [Posidoniimonas polymericola]
MTMLQVMKETETIAQRCAAIRKEWSPVERQRRVVLAKAAQDALFRNAAPRRQLLSA